MLSIRVKTIGEMVEQQVAEIALEKRPPLESLRAPCNHKAHGRALRKLPTRDGRFQYTYQCMGCGARFREAILKVKAFELWGGSEPEPFDNALKDQWEESIGFDFDLTEQHFNERAKLRREDFFRQYNEYLLTSEWRAKRSKVLKRSNGVCEGCGERPAKEVHHLTYEHVYDELLFELVALCEECHSCIHNRH